MPFLDSSNVPPALIPLLGMAEQWGIGDDFEREQAVRQASAEDLQALISSLDGIRDEDLSGWLTGPEADNPNPSEEYQAITSLLMARDSAKIILRKRAQQ